MKERFLELFDHNRSMNEDLIRVLTRPELVGQEELHKLMSHVLNVQALWCARIEGKQAPYSIWKPHSPGDMDAVDQENLAWTQKILDNGEVDRSVSYLDDIGKTHYDRLPDVLFHIIAHGIHHRGQIALLLRRIGYDPPDLDYIVWAREG